MLRPLRYSPIDSILNTKHVVFSFKPTKLKICSNPGVRARTLGLLDMGRSRLRTIIVKRAGGNRLIGSGLADAAHHAGLGGREPEPGTARPRC